MLVRRFGFLWKAIEYDVKKAQTLFHVMCKIHNICIECYIMNNPGNKDTTVMLQDLSENIVDFSNDNSLWLGWNVELDLADVGEQPTTY
jgi:hypothetical protein